MTIDFERPDDGGNEDGGGNRLFVILAVGLAGLVVLGLVAIGGVLILRNIRSQQSLAQATAVPVATQIVRVEEVIPTPTATLTPIPAVPTDVPEATPTNTPVVMPTNTPTQDEAAATVAAAPEAAPTKTPVPAGMPAGNNEVPDTGVGGFELGLIALGLVAVVFISRRLRLA